MLCPSGLFIRIIFVSFVLAFVCCLKFLCELSFIMAEKLPRSPMAQSPTSPGSPKLLSLPSPIVTRRTRTDSTSARALENPIEQGKIKSFCRSKGHGFVVSNKTKDEYFVHISDVDGEYVPLPGDDVEYRLCPIPPKFEKFQAVHVNIVHFTPEVHLKWDCPASPATQ